MTAEQDVRVGQVWRRKSDGRGFTVMEVSANFLDKQERARLANANGKKLGGPILTLSLRRLYELIGDTP